MTDAELQAFNARINRDLEETRKFVQEQHKLIEEAAKLRTEATKLESGARKLDRDWLHSPLLSLAAVISALVSVGVMFIQLRAGR